MKKFTPFLFLVCFISFGTPATAVVTPVNENAVESEKLNKEDIKNYWKGLSKKEKRAKRKALKKSIKKARAADSDVSIAALVIIGIFIPPLAMALYDGISERFWISLLLTILLFVPGLIYTLVVILKEN